jgi:hypothetical protein
VRARPFDAQPSAKRLLEVGHVTAEGAFVAHDVIGVTGKPMDTQLAVDAHGALWVAWVDGAGSWLERLACK